MRPLALLAAAAVLFAAGCTCTNPDPMRAQKKDKAYAEDPFFADGRAMRQPPDDTWPREHGMSAGRLPSGGGMDAGFVAENPLPITAEVLANGQRSFEIYCSACHGLLGDGDSAVARKMEERSPPALYGPGYDRDKPHHQLPPPVPGAPCPATPARPCAPGSVLPHPPGYYVAVMTDGYGLMPSYASALTLRQRWEVAAYVEALARSQQAPLASAPRDIQRVLQEEAP
jgi:mono/diheme cytochrome c family protein